MTESKDGEALDAVQALKQTPALNQPAEASVVARERFDGRRRRRGTKRVGAAAEVRYEEVTEQLPYVKSENMGVG